MIEKTIAKYYLQRFINIFLKQIHIKINGSKGRELYICTENKFSLLFYRGDM